MRNYFYYKSFRRAIIQFLDVFNDIRIGRYTREGELIKYIKVPLLLMPKEKVIYELTHKDKTNRPVKDLRMPMMGASMVGVDFDMERMTNKHDVLIISRSPSAGTISAYPNPTPYNLNMQLSIYARSIVDIDQILEQILPYFDPSITIRIYIDELESYFESKVFFESCSPENSVEMAEQDYRIDKWDLNFTIKTYLFRPITDQKIVKRFIQRSFTESIPWLNKENEVEFPAGIGGLETGSISVSASKYTQTTRQTINDDGSKTTEISDSQIGSDRDTFNDGTSNENKIIDKYGNKINYKKSDGYGSSTYGGNTGNKIIDDKGNVIEGDGVLPNSEYYTTSLSGKAASGAIDKDAGILLKYETFVN